MGKTSPALSQQAAKVEPGLRWPKIAELRAKQTRRGYVRSLSSRPPLDASGLRTTTQPMAHSFFLSGEAFLPSAGCMDSGGAALLDLVRQNRTGVCVRYRRTRIGCTEMASQALFPRSRRHE